MALSILINNSAPNDTSRDYVTWSPTPCRLVSTENSTRTVILRNRNPNLGGQVVFRNTQGLVFSNTIQITIPAGGTANFFIAGKFDLALGRGFPSTNDKDCRIQIVEVNTNIIFGEKSLMVRVRKNANNLTVAERNRFLDALMRLNTGLNNRYVALQNMHVNAASSEIHGRSCFLPWHRGYLLDLERKLQQINPAVTIPYWKFDVAAPNVFTRDFMGLPNAGGIVEFSATNPLINWQLQVNGFGPQNRIRRLFANNWNPNNQGAINVQRNESQTLNISPNFVPFGSQVEGDPHGGAHVSFIGQISNIGAAPC
jgi:tyrosinase